MDSSLCDLCRGGRGAIVDAVDQSSNQAEVPAIVTKPKSRSARRRIIAVEVGSLRKSTRREKILELSLERGTH